MSDPPFTTAAELVRLRADDDHRGLLFESDEWSWRQVVAESERRAALLEDLRRDGPFHVGILLENTAEYLFLLAGAALAGAVIVGINPTRTRGGAGHRHHQDRLPAGDHRLDPARPCWTISTWGWLPTGC